MESLFEKHSCAAGGEHIGETTFIVDDLVCRYCKDMVARLVTSINGVSSVNINIPEKTINVAYDSRVTDAYVIQMTLIKAGYKIIEEPGRIF